MSKQGDREARARRSGPAELAAHSRLHKLIYLGVDHLIYVIAQATGSDMTRTRIWRDQWEKMVAEENLIFGGDKALRSDSPKSGLPENAAIAYRCDPAGRRFEINGEYYVHHEDNPDDRIARVDEQVAAMDRPASTGGEDEYADENGLRWDDPRITEGPDSPESDFDPNDLPVNPRVGMSVTTYDGCGDCGGPVDAGGRHVPTLPEGAVPVTITSRWYRAEGQVPFVVLCAAEMPNFEKGILAPSPDDE